MAYCQKCGNYGKPLDSGGWCHDCATGVVTQTPDTLVARCASLERALAEARAENMKWADAFRSAMTGRDAARALLREAGNALALSAPVAHGNVVRRIDRLLAGKDGDDD